MEQILAALIIACSNMYGNDKYYLDNRVKCIQTVTSCVERESHSLQTALKISAICAKEIK